MERQEASEQREREEQEQGERKESLCWEWRPVKGRWEADEVKVERRTQMSFGPTLLVSKIS